MIDCANNRVFRDYRGRNGACSYVIFADSFWDNTGVLTEDTALAAYRVYVVAFNHLVF